MSEFLTKRSERNKILDNIKKVPMYHRMFIDLVEMEIESTREAYETTSPASEFLRGQLVSLKSLHKILTSQESKKGTN